MSAQSLTTRPSESTERRQPPTSSAETSSEESGIYWEELHLLRAYYNRRLGTSSASGCSVLLQRR
eukprot:scaffold2341_cov212-Skeletonema_menzelii.AAC.8